MSGIILLSGPRAAERVNECLVRLRHRGPDGAGVWNEGDLALGFARLASDGDGPAGGLPLQHGELVGAVDGEIFNHVELKRIYDISQSACSTEIVLSIVARKGAGSIDELDGFYSAVVLRPRTREAICLCDHIGQKPLFVGRSASEVFITSELKAIEECDWFKALPLGASSVNMDTGEVVTVSTHGSVLPEMDLATAFEKAVYKCIPSSEQPMGLFLSGGLDSSLVAAFASRCRNDVTYFILGNEDGPDRQFTDALVESLGLVDVRRVPLPDPLDLPELIKMVVRATESFNPSIVSNGLAAYLLARAAHGAGIKVVLTGEGADELFGGYHLFTENDPWLDVRNKLIDGIRFTEIRRLDRSCMAHSVEPRCPFLDQAVRGISDRLTFQDFYNGSENKVALRRTFQSVLPREVLHRRKTSFDVGSGIRGEVVRYLRRNGKSEREELREIWESLFSYESSDPYFHSYPVFDDIIDSRGEGHR